MSGKSSRTKGHSFERLIANKFKQAGYPNARRALEYQEGTGIDIENVGPFHIQCKSFKDYAPISKINEIKRKDGIPLLITKGDNKEPMVVMKLSDFLEGLMDFGHFRPDLKEEI